MGMVFQGRRLTGEILTPNAPGGNSTVARRA